MSDGLPAGIAALLAAPLPTHPESYYRPKAQSYYVYDGSNWTPADASDSGSTGNTGTSTDSLSPTLHLLTWNVDMLIPAASQRMTSALSYLSSLISPIPRSSPVVVFLQEMTAGDVVLIRDAAWVRERFYLSDVGPEHWGAGGWYGTVTLIDKALTVRQVLRVKVPSRFDRDGLLVDVLVPGQSEGKVLRLCNAHLESLAADPPVRPMQLEMLAPYLHEVDAAVLAGDLNAIQPFDRTLHEKNGLKDAFLELGGKEDSDEGYTWGYQCPKWMQDKFGCSRMDKVLFCGAVRAVGLERMGKDVMLTGELDEEERKLLLEKGGGEWVTDHLGLIARLEFEVDGQTKL